MRQRITELQRRLEALQCGALDAAPSAAPVNCQDVARLRAESAAGQDRSQLLQLAEDAVCGPVQWALEGIDRMIACAAAREPQASWMRALCTRCLARRPSDCMWCCPAGSPQPSILYQWPPYPLGSVRRELCALSGMRCLRTGPLGRWMWLWDGSDGG